MSREKKKVTWNGSLKLKVVSSLLMLSMIAQINALEAFLSVQPDTVSTVSSLTVEVFFDESLGYGGVVSIKVPDDSDLQNQYPSFNSQINHGLVFMAPGTQDNTVECRQLSGSPPKLSHC